MKLPIPEGVCSRSDEGTAFLLESRTTDYDSRRTWDSGLDAGSTPARSTLVFVTELEVFGLDNGYSIMRL